MKLILVILRLGNICGLETIKSNLKTNLRDFGTYIGEFKTCFNN